MVMMLRILPNSRSQRESSGFVCLITAHHPPTSNGFFKALLHTFCCPLQASYHSKQSLKLIIVVVVICEYSRAGLVRFLHGKSDTFIDLHAYIKHGREEHILPHGRSQNVSCQASLAQQPLTRFDIGLPVL